MPHEGSVQRACIEVLKRRKCWYTNTRTGGYGRNGVPDLIGCYRGVFFAIEVKRPMTSSKPSRAQERELRAVEKAGGIAIVACHKDDVTELLNSIDVMLKDNGRD